MSFHVLSIDDLQSGLSWHLDSPTINTDEIEAPGRTYVKIAGWMFSRGERISRFALYSELLFRSPLTTVIPTHREDVSSHFSLDEGHHTGFSFDLNLLGFSGLISTFVCAVTEDEFLAFQRDGGFFARNFKPAICLKIQCDRDYEAQGEQGNRSDCTHPLFISSLGRSGSTALISCLGKSDCVVASKHYPYESAPLTYYINLIRLSLTASSNDGALAGSGYLDTPFVASTNPFISSVSYPSVYQGFDRSAVQIFRSILRAVMERLTSPELTSDVRKPRIIVEKLSPNTLIASLSEMVWADTVEIILVRRFTDWLKSALKFSTTTGEFFGRHLDFKALETRILREVGAFLTYVSSRKGKGIVIKYEDLVNGDQCVRTLCELLKVPVTQEMLEAFKTSEPRHKTESVELPNIYQEIMASGKILELQKEFDVAFQYTD